MRLEKEITAYGLEMRRLKEQANAVAKEAPSAVCRYVTLIILPFNYISNWDSSSRKLGGGGGFSHRFSLNFPDSVFFIPRKMLHEKLYLLIVRGVFTNYCAEHFECNVTNLIMLNFALTGGKNSGPKYPK